MSVFWAQSKNGKLSLGTNHNRLRFMDDLSKNKGARYRIERQTPESKKQRKFFEGAVVPLVAYFQENLDHRDHNDLQIARDWLKIEFLGELVEIKGKTHKVGKTTKDKLNSKPDEPGLVDRVIDWIEENYGVDRQVVLNPKEYKKWRDTVFPYGGPDNYIDYLVELKKLPRLSTSNEG